ncbi:hypothetical protein QX241_27160, partial [Klebsiella pneumoniae]|uniref:hypothetical protein n=1 Tax=Klebsiella pneumoniae TaxID=573 RepID=UPI0025B34841
QNDVTLKMPAFEWVHVQLHQQKGMISLSPPTICNSAPGKYGAALNPPLRGKRWPEVETAFFTVTVSGSRVEILPLKFKVLMKLASQ